MNMETNSPHSQLPLAEEIFARLNLHEYALEVALALMAASLPPAMAERLMADFLEKAKEPVLSGDARTSAREQLEARVHARALQMTERFTEKVLNRQADIRRSFQRVA